LLGGNNPYASTVVTDQSLRQRCADGTFAFSCTPAKSSDKSFPIGAIIGIAVGGTSLLPARFAALCVMRWVARSCLTCLSHVLWL
jgi:hypothetical protein